MKKTVLYFLGFALLMLTILFLWNELTDISVHKKINSSKIADYFTAVGAVVAVLTLFYIYNQLVEINTDRKASVFPDLHPESTRLITLDKQLNLLPSKEDSEIKGLIRITRAYFYHYNELITDLNDYSSKPEALIKLKNIGKGPAKNIEVNWLYDFEKVKELFSSIYKNELTIDSTDDIQRLSVITCEKDATIKLPMRYMACCGQQVNSTNIEKPVLRLQLSYQNLFDDKIEKKEFHIKIKKFGKQWVDFTFEQTTIFNISNKKSHS